MLGNVILLCVSLFSIFGIVGVQLWKGVLRNRCFFDLNTTLINGTFEKYWFNEFYQPEFSDSFVCSEQGTSGMNTCSNIQKALNKSAKCNASIEFLLSNYNKTDLEEKSSIYSQITKWNNLNDTYMYDNDLIQVC